MFFGQSPAECLGSNLRLRLLPTSEALHERQVGQMATHPSLFRSKEAAGAEQPQTTGDSKVSYIWLRDIYEYWCSHSNGSDGEGI